MFPSVAATAAEQAEPRPGDELVAPADVVMDRGFTVAGRPETVWPWIVQLGKQRAGWYLPRAVERLLPHRALRHVDQRWQRLAPGDVVPDYGGRHETFTVVTIDPPSVLVYRSRRGRTNVSWSIVLRPDGGRTRVLLRLRMGPVRRVWLAGTAGGFFDLVTVAGVAAGLRERLSGPELSSGRRRRT